MMFLYILFQVHEIFVKIFQSVLALLTINTMSASVSDGWRMKGNVSYGNYMQSNDNERKKSYLQFALKSYYRAFETAENSDEKSSAAKNCAMASWQLASVLHSLMENQSQVEFYFCEAIKYFSKVVFMALHIAIIFIGCRSSEIQTNAKC